MGCLSNRRPFESLQLHSASPARLEDTQGHVSLGIKQLNMTNFAKLSAILADSWKRALIAERI